MSNKPVLTHFIWLVLSTEKEIRQMDVFQISDKGEYFSQSLKFIAESRTKASFAPYVARRWHYYVNRVPFE